MIIIERLYSFKRALIDKKQDFVIDITEVGFLCVSCVISEIDK